MVEQLRRNEKMRETFGRYIDPRVVETLVDRPALAATDGQRRVMTVLFCDMKGFTSLSEGMTPQGLVKVMNHFLSAMSEQVRNNHGVIDKYIGDADHGLLGPPFTENGEDARLACLAAIGMLGRIAALRTELPELLGVRAAGSDCDVRIGIATGEVLVGSIGSEFMMSYTVMGDTVNLASRLEGANKVYGSRCLISEATRSPPATRSRRARSTGWWWLVKPIPRRCSRSWQARRSQAGAIDVAGSLCRRTGGLSRASLGRCTPRLQRRARSCPGDEPSKILIKRMDDFEANPPAGDWDGAWHFDHK